MPSFNLFLNRSDILRLYFRLSQCQAVGGRLALVVAFMARMLKVWPELAPGESPEIANLIPADLRRPVAFTAEEQTAVSDALSRLLNADVIPLADGIITNSNVGIKLEVLKDIALLGPAIHRHVLRRLSDEPIEAFAESVTDSEESKPIV